MNKPKVTVVEPEVEYGLYLWQGPSGAYLNDGHGNFFSIPAKRGDLKAIARITAEAKAMGFGDGKAVYHPGARQVTDEEYDLMMERLEAGMIADAAEEYLDFIEGQKGR